ncbi:MAG: hypothetical protein U0269_31360 [Polyangiales bacterium]
MSNGNVRLRAILNCGVCALSALLAGCMGAPDPSTLPPFVLTPSTGPSVQGYAQCTPGQASAQFRAQIAPPGELFPGARATVALAFDNCSGSTWSPDDVAIRPANEAADRWGISRVPLPGQVLDGRRAVVFFEVVAPAELGSYPFEWQVVRGANDRMQVASPRVDVVVRSAADCSEPGTAIRYRRQRTPPAFVGVGAEVSGELVFANCGTTPLRAADGFALAYVGESERGRFGVESIPLPNDISPGSEVTIRVAGRAPEAVGRYVWQWQMARAGEAVGERSAAFTVTALRPFDCGQQGSSVRVLREDVPSEVDPGQRFDGHVTLANCGGAVWNEMWALRESEPAGGGRWGTSRVGLPLNVGVGFQIDVTINATAPGQPGSYPWRWALGRDGEGLERDATESRSVRVRCIPYCGDRNCGDNGCGGSCGSCGANATCEGGHCVNQGLDCGSLQWWNSALTYAHMSGAWFDTDLNVRAGTAVVLRHDSRLDRTGVYAWGYMPEFTDLVTGYRFRLLHLRPQAQYATNVGRVYPSGYVVGLSGGDTRDTGYPTYSTGSHLCVQTLQPYRQVFPTGRDGCH